MKPAVQERVEQLLAQAEDTKARVADQRNAELERLLTISARRLQCEAFVLMVNGDKDNSSGGRPSKFTVPVLMRIFEAIEVGAKYQMVCDYAGVAYSVFADWRARGKAGEPGFSEFTETIHAIEAQVGIEALKAWRAHFERDWKAARDFMRLRFPESWSPTVKHEFDPASQPQPSTLHITIGGPDAAAMRQLMVGSRSMLPAPDYDVADERPLSVIDVRAR